MTTTAEHSRFHLIPMRPRDPEEPGRTASPLELFFDLVFVIAVSIAAGQLHHALTEAHIADGLVAYGICFFAIWWAWMNFTWFGTSFSTDDWLYRTLTIVQMSGVLVLAAGIEPLFIAGDNRVAVLGYVVMRIAMVAQWIRASRGAGDARATAIAYAVGIAVVQALWLIQMTLPTSIRTGVFLLLVVAELAVPVIAERRAGTMRHPHHITERYSLFTLILLGESLLASSTAIYTALHEQAELLPLITIAVLTLVITAALWWVYFWPPHHRAITTFACTLRYGYVHYFVFAAAGAFSAGIEVQIDRLMDHSKLSALAASFTVSVPVAVFLLGIWWIAIRQSADRTVNVAVPVAAALVLLDPLLPVPILLIALVMVGLVVILVIHRPVDEEADSTGSLVAD